MLLLPPPSQLSEKEEDIKKSKALFSISHLSVCSLLYLPFRRLILFGREVVKEKLEAMESRLVKLTNEFKTMKGCYKEWKLRRKL